MKEEYLSIEELREKYPWMVTPQLEAEYPAGTGHYPLIDHSPTVSGWIVTLVGTRPIKVEPHIRRMEK